MCTRTRLRRAAELSNAAPHPSLAHMCMNLQDFIAGDYFAVCTKKGLSETIRYQSRQDFSVSCQDCLDQANKQHIANRPRIVWQHLRSLLAMGGSSKYSSKKPLPMLLNMRDKPASSEKQVAKTFLHSFANIEKAQLQTMEQTISDYNVYAATRSVPDQVQLAGVQSFRQCVHSLYSANPYRAAS